MAWSENQQIRTQTLPGLAMGLPRHYVGNGRTPRIVYSATAREFLVVWSDFGVRTWRLWARRVALDGRPVGPIIDLADASESGSGYLDLTWNPITNEYAVSYVSLFPICCGSNVAFARLGADGIVLTQTLVARGVRADQLRVAVNSHTGEYILVWWDIEGTFAAEISATGRVVSPGRIDTSRFAGDRSLAFNPASGTFLTTERSGDVLQFRELNQYGAPLGAPKTSTQLTSAVISSPPATPDWRVFGHLPARYHQRFQLRDRDDRNAVDCRRLAGSIGRLLDSGSIRCIQWKRVLRWRLVATGSDGARHEHHISGRMRDTRSLRLARWRALRQWRMVSARQLHGSGSPSSTGTHAATNARRLCDAGSVRCAWRRHVRAGRVVFTRHGGPSTIAATADCWRLPHAGSVYRILAAADV